MYSNNDLPDVKEFKDPGLIDKLESSQEWLKLTDIQKKICIFHWNDPDLSTKELASLVGCTVQTVYRLFNTPTYELISLETDKIEYRKLRRSALKALSECLRSPKDAVKLTAAVAILKRDLMQSESGPKDTPKEVSWGMAGGTP